MLNPCFTPFTQGMGIFLKYLVGMVADEEIEAVF
jgi:hypothetical protein